MMLPGRDEEIVTLDALFRDCVSGRGGVAVIRGPVTSGKTTLLEAFAEWTVAAGADSLGAVASRAERGLPFGVLDQLFRGRQLPAAIATRVAGLLAELLASQAGTGPQAGEDPQAVSSVQARAFDGLLGVLAELSEARPLVITVDDIQYADVASLQCLSYLARRVGASPIFTVLTECTHMLPADRLLHAEILRQGNCHCIPLPPLPPSSVALLLAEHVDAETAQRLAPACHAMTGGNPLLVNALGEDLRVSPEGPAAELAPGPAFRSAVVACLHRHEPKMVELGQTVAVLGEDAALGLLGELLVLSPESVEQGMDALCASGLLEAGRFRHEQARQAVLGQMSADERAAMHGNAARTLYRTGASPSTLARHLVAAHRIGARWAVTALQEAAAQAVSDGEADRAIDYLRRAESECADDRQSATIRFELACAEWPMDPECAARHLAELVGNARAGLLDSECLGELAYYLLWVGDTSSAREILTALDHGSADPAGQAGPAGPARPTGPTGSAASGARYATIRSPLDFLYPDLAGRARQAAREARGPALAAARDPKGPALATVRDAKGHAPATKEDGEATVLGAERILSERSMNDPTLASITTALMALICEDMLDRAADWCGMLLREAEASRRGPLWPAVLTAFFAMIETRSGNLPAAENHARTALKMLSKKAWGVAIGGPLSSLLLATTASRKHEEAAACLRTPVPEAMFGTFYGLLYLYARGEYYLATGRPQAALADFTDCGNRMMSWGLDLPGLVPWRTKAAEAHLVMGNSLEARQLSKAQLAQVGSRFPRTRGISLRALALTSHPTKRTALLRESAEVLRDSGARLELAYTFTELSNAHLALGEHGRAHWAARQARNLAERCGAQAPKTTLGTIDPNRREQGNGVDAKLLAQLSDAEQRVAMLAAYGYTNGQIAHKLYITVSTVEQHLTRVYRKLGVAGRAELPIEVYPSPPSA
jgi:DNA-binding CsgD family transcriptional regulator